MLTKTSDCTGKGTGLFIFRECSKLDEKAQWSGFTNVFTHVYEKIILSFSPVLFYFQIFMKIVVEMSNVKENGTDFSQHVSCTIRNLFTNRFPVFIQF